MFETAIVSAYSAVLAVLFLYGVHRLAMLRAFRWGEAEGDVVEEERLPVVTVQLPLFNERTVARRLLRAVGELDYPRARLEVQVLDDSTDETRELVDREVARLVEQGLDARVVRRADRTGFKAGALDHGLRRARGTLLCVFDADFVPTPGFLRALVGEFEDPRVGMVQARWGHENRDESALTRAQSALLDGHFVIEHTARHLRGHFFNFNGTAGVWRRAAIEEAGGWQHDTLTEDLDLSYRAQLAGWRFVYRPLVVVPAEVPPDIAAFKSQQHRWAKGSAQVLRKLGRRLVAARVPVRTRLEALAHLSGNTGYPAVLAMALLLPLTPYVAGVLPGAVHLASFLVCTVTVFVFYERSQRALRRPLARRLGDTLGAVVLGIGMSVSQTRAVLAGLIGPTGTFVRTPKRGEGAGAGAATYARLRAELPGVELLVAAWLAFGCWSAVETRQWLVLPFLLLFLVSFTWVGTLSLRSAFARVPA